jgi:hypothetical protein
VVPQKIVEQPNEPVIRRVKKILPDQSRFSGSSMPSMTSASLATRDDRTQVGHSGQVVYLRPNRRRWPRKLPVPTVDHDNPNSAPTITIRHSPILLPDPRAFPGVQGSFKIDLMKFSIRRQHLWKLSKFFGKRLRFRRNRVKRIETSFYEYAGQCPAHS